MKAITPDSATETDSFGNTMLHIACSYGQERLTVPIMAALIEANPDGPRTKGWLGSLPLHWAAYSSVPIASTKVLLEAYEGALTIQNQHGKTPLDYAQSEKNMALIELQNNMKAKATEIIRGSALKSAKRLRNNKAAEQAAAEQAEADRAAAEKAAAENAFLKAKSLGVATPERR